MSDVSNVQILFKRLNYLIIHYKLQTMKELYFNQTQILKIYHSHI